MQKGQATPYLKPISRNYFCRLLFHFSWTNVYFWSTDRKQTILKKYNVVIVGAGPSGLRCAEILSTTDFPILLLEKNSVFGEKVCAGGITRKGFDMLQIPDEVIEHKVTEVGMHSGNFQNIKTLPEAVVFTVNRPVFAKWQLQLLNDTPVHVRNNAKVTKINEKSVIVNDAEEIGFDFLVGADGPLSIVRKHLNIPVEKVLATVQYIIPIKDQSSQLDIYLNPKYFHSWYAWTFPHKNSLTVGACCDPKIMSGKTLKANFHKWLAVQGIDVSKAKYESFPISYDYRGLRFGNVFLAGEAAGLASGFTGEGIFQSLVSGEEVARLILNKPSPSEDFKYVLKYNKIQHNFLKFMIGIGPARSLVADLIILFMRNPLVNKKISKGFS